ncbi:MAG: glycosyltransferase [Acidimicrobiales bacterium]
MRILHVVKGLGPGGAERLLVSLAGARSAGVDVDVAYVLPWKAQLVPDLQARGAGVHVLGGRRGLADQRWAARLSRLVRWLRPDVVHLHSPAVAAVARPLLRLRRGRPAIVSTEHNVWGSFGPLTRVANGVTLPLADATLAVSDEVKASVWRPLRERVEVTLQGIPVAELVARRGEREEARARLGIRPDDVLVVSVANFREKKDHPTLLAAAAACHDDPRLRFASVGQGPLEGQMHERHRQLGLGDRFRFLGYQADPISVVAGADVFTLTSRHEGLPISLLEAMALGVPPVVSAVGGIPEVVTDGEDGILVPPGSSSDFAAAYRRLAGEPAERARLGEAAARRAAGFDIATTQRWLEARYRELLDRRPG